MRHMPDDSYCYIAHYMDHWSKFHVLWPLINKSAIEVASGLVHKVFPYFGLPKYCSQIMEGNLLMKLLERY